MLTKLLILTILAGPIHANTQGDNAANKKVVEKSTGEPADKNKTDNKSSKKDTIEKKGAIKNVKGKAETVALPNKGKPMFARFETTLGDFKVKLFNNEAPRTVENFVSLAEGTKEWTNPKDGKKGKNKLYDGTIFHRVIPGFMIQGGDPLGNGRGAPSGEGFPFKDEFNPKLRHDKAGILSMANSGPNSNGSQFFVTVAPTPHLNDRHSIFGEVVEGLDVVKKISETKTVSDRPVTEVVLKHVKIERQ